MVRQFSVIWGSCQFPPRGDLYSWVDPLAGILTYFWCIVQLFPVYLTVQNEKRGFASSPEVNKTSEKESGNSTWWRWEKSQVSTKKSWKFPKQKLNTLVNTHVCSTWQATWMVYICALGMTGFAHLSLSMHVIAARCGADIYNKRDGEENDVLNFLDAHSQQVSKLIALSFWDQPGTFFVLKSNFLCPKEDKICLTKSGCMTILKSGGIFFAPAFSWNRLLSILCWKKTQGAQPVKLQAELRKASLFKAHRQRKKNLLTQQVLCGSNACIKEEGMISPSERMNRSHFLGIFWKITGSWKRCQTFCDTPTTNFSPKLNLPQNSRFHTENMPEIATRSCSYEQ